MKLTHKLDLELEGSMYIGIIISGVLYGIYLGVYLLSVYTVSTNQKTTHLRKAFFIVYSSFQFFFNTIFFMGIPLIGQRMWVTNRNGAGGPPVYLIDHYTRDNYVVLGSIAQNIAIFLADVLLTYRCYIIFGSRMNIILLPTLLTLSSFALLMATVPMNDSNSSLFSLGLRLSAAAIVLNMANNVIVTVMMSVRILAASYKARKHGIIAPQYVGIVAILIESAAPCATLGILEAAVTLSPTTQWDFAVFLTWSLSLALFSQLIVLRMAKGIAWTTTSTKTNDFSYSIDTMVFAIPESSNIEGVHELYELPHNAQS